MSTKIDPNSSFLRKSDDGEYRPVPRLDGTVSANDYSSKSDEPVRSYLGFRNRCRDLEESGFSQPWDHQGQETGFTPIEERMITDLVQHLHRSSCEIFLRLIDATFDHLTNSEYRSAVAQIDEIFTRLVNCRPDWFPVREWSIMDRTERITLAILDRALWSKLPKIMKFPLDMLDSVVISYVLKGARSAITRTRRKRAEKDPNFTPLHERTRQEFLPEVTYRRR